MANMNFMNSCKRVFVVLMIVLAGSVEAGWTNNGGDRDWNNPVNWSENEVPSGAGGKVKLNNGSVPGPIVSADTPAFKEVKLGAGGTGDLTIDDGVFGIYHWLAIGMWDADDHGTITINGGSVGTVDTGEYSAYLMVVLGHTGTGIMHMNGGRLVATRTGLRMGLSSGSTSRLYLYGGTIEVAGLDLGSGDILIDVTYGTLIVNGDKTADLQAAIAAGQIVAFGGCGALEMDYDVRNPGRTTLTATGNPPPVVEAGADAVTWLTDGIAVVPLDGTVTSETGYSVQWTDISNPSPGAVVFGDEASEDTSVTVTAPGSYEVQLEADNGECAVSDTVLIEVYADGCQYAQTQAGYVPLLGDINNDCRVDMEDFETFSVNWLLNNSLSK